MSRRARTRQDNPPHTAEIGRLRLIWSVAFLGGILLAAYALLVEPARLRLDRIRVSVPGADRPQRFLLLSDLHLRPWSHRTYRRIAYATRWARAHGVTHVLIAGDLLEDDREAGLVARRLRRALGVLPALYVTGNHEVMGEGWISGPQRNDRLRVSRSMAEHGIHRIDERAVDLDGIAVVGIGWHQGVGPGPLIRGLLASSGRAVVLAHSPDHVVGLPPDRVIVALCGHTHGGQVRLPLIGAPWLPVRSPLPRLSGVMSLSGVTTFVSRGIGATIPVRLGAVPEATLIEIAPL